jgi:palmitoyltransferase ZDHHC9/14/18
MHAHWQCGNCVDGIGKMDEETPTIELIPDHHCAYLHICVGKRNYLSFLVTVISAVSHRSLRLLDGKLTRKCLSAIYIVVFSAIHFLLICRYERVSFARALRDSPGAAVSFLLGVLILPAMLFLLAYHIRVGSRPGDLNFTWTDI